MKHTTNIIDLIGNTPLIKINHFETGTCELYLKLESYNPGGSIKDRVGLSMITQAEKEGKLKKGNTIIEATAGNTGIGLALVAALKGYPLVLVIPDKMAQEKINHLRALGAKIIMTRSDVEKGHPDYYQDLAVKISQKDPQFFYINQFNNPANPQAHEATTAPEIWEQMNQKVDAIICGVGSGGTITGISRFFAKMSPSTEFVLADPQGSILADFVTKGSYGAAGAWLVEGIGEDFIPPIVDLSQVKKAYSISDEDSFAASRALFEKEGILAGSSSGTLFAAALKYCQESTRPKRVVSFVCDTGNKYLSKMFNSFWLRDHGFFLRDTFNDLRDLVVRNYTDNEITSVGPDDTLLVAHARMRLYDYSLLPVIDNGNVVGVIDEFDLLNALRRENSLHQKIHAVMSTNLVRLNSHSTLQEVFFILEEGMAPLIYHLDKFYGIITKSDLLNYMRKNPNAKI